MMISSYKKERIIKAVISLGYTKAMIQKNFSFLGSNGKATADMIAFGNCRHFDMETACLGIHFQQNGNSEILRDFIMLAIPYAILAYSDKVEIWPLRESGPDRENKVERPYDQLDDFFAENRINFAPDSIMKAKEQGRQLSFADLDMGMLYDWSFNATKKRLKSNFESAIENARMKLKKAQFQSLSKVSIKLLAAAVLQDKGYLKPVNGLKILKSAQHLYPNYFLTEDIQRLDKKILEDLLKDIRAGGCVFTNLTTEMLDHLYQYAFVDEKLRKKLGIYATPPKLARMIAGNLPFEDIRPEDLFLLDGACGSGSLLAAGYKRLYDLLPVRKSENEKHQYLSDHILGMDRDLFATEIARLSLLHESLPSGNKWNIQTKDFLKTGSQDFPARPFVILANPPYREARGENRIEMAVPFVEKNLDLLRDNGLMAIILPETFLQKSSCRNVRNRILHECEILDLWQLPEGVFGESGSATTVLFLRKNTKKTGSLPVRIKRVLNKDKTLFLNRGHASFSYVFPDQNHWIQTDFQIIPNIFNRLWDRISEFRKLGDMAEIRNGITPGKGREDQFCHDDPPGEWKKWLNGPSAIRHFLIDWENQRRTKKPFANRYVNWPGKLYRPITDLEKIFDARNRKIIMNARRNPNTRWRITAAIDDVGYFPSYDLFLLFDLKQNVTLEELTAVLNHSVSSAWIDDHIRLKYLRKNELRQLPVPEFDKLQKKDLKRLVRKLMRNPNTAEYKKRIIQIDEILDSAYGLSDEEKRCLKASGFVRKGFDEDIFEKEKELFPNKTWTVTGIVEDIDAGRNKVEVWFRGCGEDAAEIPIPREMPGWALRTEVAFEAEIPFEQRHRPDWSQLRNFQPIRYGYMDEEELLAELDG
ncbi:HsdM family class I SAM-dependent methyltransferase [Desulfonema magnum]|uniref:SAM-dependent methyltransferase n=1 Tax=Desulfonema magnum TaxID=45655 RepID=A0A975BQ69_9BACT|nr:N-6 DNA methylase [Desulfonema magnum]QTA89671.1 SAM-dependent methyltransferase [Desulfonema magnum]